VRHGSVGRLWRPVLLWLSLLILPASAVIAQPAADRAEVNAPAVLRIGNRDVTIFRVPFAGASPAQRARAVAERVETYRNEEFTIPNAVVVDSQIKNYSRLAKTKGATIATTVSIGYDAPWRQVAAMLIEAARRTGGIRQDIAPRVLQRELADFYVKYELVAHIERPHTRASVLNTLHENMLDLFNEHDVQIMSPNFVSQPERKVVVPKERWVMPPASLTTGRDKV
jgi:small-conductance mechanosensitive channel